MMTKIIAVLIVVLVLWSTAGTAGDARLSRVVEVGPAAWVPFIGPLKWSSDGTQLAYFSQAKLMIADTLGVSRIVKDSCMPPRRFGWIAPDKIAVYFMAVGDNRARSNRFVIIDVNSGQEQVVDTSVTWPGMSSAVGATSFDGPFYTLEGSPYILHTTNLDSRPPQISQVQWLLPDQAAKMPAGHVIRWGLDGLYRCTVEGGDSVRISLKPFRRTIAPTAISADQSYAINGGVIIRLVDSTVIVLDTLIKSYPEGTKVCGFGFCSFSPSGREVLFQLSCDDGHAYESNRIGTFDLISHEFTILDTLLGLSECCAPAYSPDGRKIAFLSEGKAYIAYREE